MSEDDTKVISLGTRSAYVPPEVEAIGVETIRQGPAVDEAAIELVKMVLKDLEEGTVSGIALMTWRNEDQVFDTAVAPPFAKVHAEPEISKLAFMWLGGLTLLKENIEDIAFSAGKYGCTCGECQ